MPHPTPVSLLTRAPEMTGAEMAASLVPPRQFAGATLESYRPDPDFPSQTEAVERVRAFAEAMRGGGGGGRGLFGRRKSPETKAGIYLDGGFGVGKTHLLAALWHLAPGRTYFGTFIEYTALVGALGYAQAVELLRGSTFVAIDEFELDDPGDTMVMTRLLGELASTGTRIAATSNTPPNALGEGRFAAADFLREIQALSDRFEILRIDGLDYRRRDVEGHAVVTDDADLETKLSIVEGETALDDFDGLLRHLAKVHPSRYIRIVEGLAAVGLRGVHTLTDQADALRFVAFIDRLYDEQVRVVASGTPLDEVFGDEMLAGGYRKKYLRAVSRLIALTN
ncbi:cell division protein ZapE [Homoserinibacter sp. GY 40078]|uniref:cell division protein ZapE n=1 Tax=Homoserinibacter sp. GY 40078 TaxID=2603275 RepID=UPI0011CAFE92|nr:cell division protein ZapE [Homoserinibacter sp. GY 40078]TXK17508.1 cell division protein ZapE [Homoserinibacter sp. GY 40078]